MIFAGAWILMAVGYSYSGLTKLTSPSWLDGTAITYVLENPWPAPDPFGMPSWSFRVARWRWPHG
jgi:hypothetical protein